MKNNTRRGFMGKAFGAVAAVGAIGSLVAMKKTWDPLPSVKAAGFTTLDMSVYQENKLAVEKWRGKPIFVLKKTAAMVADQTEIQSVRDIVVDGAHYMVSIGLCTHLGCIPSYNANDKDFLCACHGGKFDYAGEVTKVPPPRGLDIPPFKIEGNTLVLGEKGPEYMKMKETGVTL
ncbi:ubiquinol-cytochrome c reductase iron-sulfur subunit [Sulfurimonas sp. SAG-AH-194-I05]|nr:ubiquinol-cytochrome c reductase iron-sulfur subunit [Sulfurimonas sp. SAG-AH-194-I05]MDF1874164.1 ubiquinol-cytochrome c reductase iron-sulfur subunit [Sulfurimonas sp. SAG-AH-194-I05]